MGRGYSTALRIVQKRFPQVTQVVDARRSIKIEVTDRDAASKAVKNHQECAMAQACKRKLKLDGAIISLERAYLIKGNRAVRFHVSGSVSREVTSFDRGGGFATGTYALGCIPATERLGCKPGYYKHKSRGTGRKQFLRHRTENVRAMLGSRDE